MLGMKIVVDSLPLFLHSVGTVASKIVKPAKLSSNSSFVELVAHRIPLNATLPIVTAQHGTMLTAFTHDMFGSHSRTRAKLIW